MTFINALSVGARFGQNRRSKAQTLWKAAPRLILTGFIQSAEKEAVAIDQDERERNRNEGLKKLVINIYSVNVTTTLRPRAMGDKEIFDKSSPECENIIASCAHQAVAWWALFFLERGTSL